MDDGEATQISTQDSYMCTRDNLEAGEKDACLPFIPSDSRSNEDFRRYWAKW